MNNTPGSLTLSQSTLATTIIMRYPLLVTLAFTLQAATAEEKTAEEYTVEPKAFEVETTLEAVFLPDDSHAIRIAPDSWTDFTITSLLEHGTKVKKGDILIGIDTRKLDKDIADKEKSIALSQLKLARTRHELEQLKITTPRSLEAKARAEKEAAEKLEHYTSTEHAIDIENAKRRVKSAEFYLSAEQEELQQLLKMYEEDSKTEETEEIILKRARHHVDRAEFNLKSAKISSEWQLGTTIPRKLKTMQREAQDARIAHADAKQNLPRALQIKQQETDKAAKDLEQEVEKLAKLKADRAMMNITAPAEGIIYYGEIKNGQWQAASAAKVLKIGKKLPAHTTLMSLIASGTALQLYSQAAEKDLGALDSGASGYAITKLNSYRSFPVTISSIASLPDTGGSFPTILKADLPDGLTVAPGTKATAKIITNKIDQALKIPSEYLSNTSDGGHTVKVKLADGKTADRKVTISASNDKWAVVTAGLEKDQVIVK